MGKKKKKKKTSKSKPHPDANLTVKQLVIKGSQLLSQGNARDALELFKQVEKKTGRNEEIDSCLFSAYLVRQEQLFEKGLVAESEAVKKEVCEYFPGIEKVSEEQMAAYLRCCSAEGAFSAYRYYISKKGTSTLLEGPLADLLLQGQGWQYLDGIDSSIPLVRDSEVIKKAIPLMEKGQWEKALEALGSIARLSPFAPVRMFCRAMVAFYKEDDKAFVRSIAMIPDDFFLKPLLDALELTITETNDEPAKIKAFQYVDFLYEGALDSENKARELFFELNHKQAVSCANKVKMLAKSIYPEDVDVAIIEILHILRNLFFDERFQENQFKNLTKKVLPKNKAELMIAKFAFLASNKALSHAGRYLEVLPIEFPDVEEKKIAHSLILQNTIKAALKKNGDSGECVFENMFHWAGYKSLLGVKSSDRDMIPVEILQESIRLDPDNRAGYELLSRLPLYSRDAKSTAEDIYLSMMKRFADDPYPCLELANLYYSKNAFRKAENVLQIAMKRAPHDNRVLDRHALALVISAEKNLNSGRYHLSWPDLEKAHKLERRKHSVLVAAKRALHRNIAEHESIEDAIDKETQNFSIGEYLRTFGIVLIDLEGGKIKNNTTVLSELRKNFKKKVKQVSQLSSTELIALLTPLDNQYTTLLPSVSVAALFTKYYPKILSGLSDEDLLTVIDRGLEPSLFPILSKELQHRARKSRGSKSLIFEFYMAVIEHMSGQAGVGDRFLGIINRASEKERKKLEAASHRLAFHAKGDLRTALQNFDFEILNPIFPKPSFGQLMEILEQLNNQGGRVDSIRKLFEQLPGSFDPSMEDMIDFLDDDEDDELWETAEELEDMLDESGIRDAPESLIKDFRNHMRSSPKNRRYFDDLASELKPIADELTREAQIFLYGKTLA